jgi:DNA processing protein
MIIENYKEFYNHLTEIEKKNSPDKLYFKGDFSLLYKGLRVSVVGSRKPTPEGELRAEIITKALIKKEIIIVSGLAQGIDTIAHKTAIKYGGKTIAVLGTHLNNPYPKENSNLLEIIKKDHLAISQFPENFPITKKNFPIRNRTMALISDATIIIEASENSGTKHQGWEALRLGRNVYILENIVNDPSLTWPKEMINYGAQKLTRNEFPNIFDDIPYLTMRTDYAF